MCLFEQLAEALGSHPLRPSRDSCIIMSPHNVAVMRKQGNIFNTAVH